MAEEKKTLRVTQVRSAIAFPEKQRRVLKAMGLGRIGKSHDFCDTPQVRGMIFKVKHLVKVEEI